MAATTSSTSRLPPSSPGEESMHIVLGHGAGDAKPPKKTPPSSIIVGVAGGGETERMWATSQDGWVITYDTETLTTALCSNDPDAVATAAAPGDDDDDDAGAGRKIVVLPSFGRTPPADSSCCTLSGDPTDGGGFTVVIIEPPNGSALWYCHVGFSSVASAKWDKVEYDVETLLS
uniref:Uncharacterized protein n=1 Tax=Oryza punctata TaxID=4537 RepID=A0A0E0L7H4_ORYPU